MKTKWDFQEIIKFYHQVANIQHHHHLKDNLKNLVLSLKLSNILKPSTSLKETLRKLQLMMSKGMLPSTDKLQLTKQLLIF